MPYNLNSDEHYFYPDQGTDAATAVPWNNMTTIVLEKDEASSNHPNMVLTGVLMGLVTVFTIALCYLTIPSLLQWIRQKIPVSKARVQRRYETVEGWLISKRVRAHCDTCKQLQAQLGTPAKKLPHIKLATSYDTAETVLADVEEGKECPVCMEPFTVDEIVSWSPTKYCDHVFHHECIKEWLLHHENCPYCRVTFLPVDKDTATANNDDTAATTTNTDESSSSTTTSIFASSKPRTVRELTALAQQRTQRLMTTYYCLDEGLVTLLDRPSPPTAAGKDNNDAENSNTNHGNSNKKKLTRAMKQLLSTGIQLGELSEMRGSKIRATVDDDNNVAASNNTVTVNVVASTDDEGDDNETAPAAPLSSGFTPPPPPPPQALNFAHAVVDIEMCMTQLRALSNNSHDDDDSVASGSSR